mgnify:CR=1 FL=1
MKRVYLVHGWEASSKSDFFPWLKKELEKKNMPNTEEPKIEEWVGFLKKKIKEIDKETVFIGHSIGCQAVLRFLETLPKDVKVKKVILVAPWMQLDKERIKEEGEEVRKIVRPWMETPINWKKVRSHCIEFICIFSDNDPYVPLSNRELFKKRLNAKSITLNNRHHFDMGSGIFKLPEILKFL